MQKKVIKSFEKQKKGYIKIGGERKDMLKWI